MRRSFVILASFLFPLAVFACEGDCITGITHAFYTNYTAPVDHILRDTDTQLRNLVSAAAMPLQLRQSASSFTYLEPLYTSYSQSAPSSLQTAIFPSHFHGKCQADGEQPPPGCPDPDCPVLCGTPGSLIHFYSDLRFIAFNDTRFALQTLASSTQESIYNQIEQAVVNDWKKNGSRGTEKDVKVQVKKIMGNLPSLLEQFCGGSQAGDAFNSCSWEQPMKTYILSFP